MQKLLKSDSPLADLHIEFAESPRVCELTLSIQPLLTVSFSPEFPHAMSDLCPPPFSPSTNCTTSLP